MSPLLTHLTFLLESSSSSSSSSYGISDLRPECPHNEEWSLKVSGNLRKTIPSFPSPEQIYLCYDVEAIIKWFFCNHVKYTNMHFPTSGKINQLKRDYVLIGHQGIFNRLKLNGCCLWIASLQFESNFYQFWLWLRPIRTAATEILSLSLRQKKVPLILKTVQGRKVLLLLVLRYIIQILKKMDSLGIRVVS